jgi:hypothetical protein
VNSTRQPFSDKGKSKRRRQVGLSAAGRAKAQEIGALIEPGVTGGERLHLGLGDHRHGGEVEGV